VSFAAISLCVTSQPVYIVVIVVVVYFVMDSSPETSGHTFVYHRMGNELGRIWEKAILVYFIWCTI
jgi:hypothetical protein